MNPKVSVIVPFHNDEIYFEKCMRSILDQSFKNLEIICVNNHSEDGSLAIANFFSSISSRVYVFNSNSNNFFDSMNKAIIHSNGDFIVFINPNSFLNKNYIEKFINQSISEDSDISFSKHHFFNHETQKIDFDYLNHRNMLLDRVKFDENYLGYGFHTCYNNFYKKEFLLENNIQFKTDNDFADLLFFYESYLSAKKWSIVYGDFCYHVFNDKCDNDFLDLKFYMQNNSDFPHILNSLEYVADFFMDYDGFDSIIRKIIFLSFITYLQLNIDLKRKFYDLLLNFYRKYNLLDYDYNNLDYKIQTNFRKFIKTNTFDEFNNLYASKDFSIIIPIYNSELYLEDAIESIINQDFSFIDNVELILVDDGSLDNSYMICQEYQKSYPNNIHLIKNDNLGVSAARNLGLSCANGHFINFLDSDDKFNSNVLSEVFSFFNEHNAVDVVSIPIRYFERVQGNGDFNDKFHLNDVIDLNNSSFIPYSVSSSFITKNAIGEIRFDESLTFGEDGIFLNKILLKNHFCGVLDSTFYKYRKRNNKSSILDNIKNLDYISFLKSLKDLLILSQENVANDCHFIQNFILYSIEKFFVNLDVDLFDSEVLNDLYLLLYQIFNRIDLKYINYPISNELKYFMLYNSQEKVIELNYISFNENDESLNLYFNQNFLFNDNVKCFIENQEYELEYYNAKSIFGKSFFKEYQLTIPLNLLNYSMELIFKDYDYSFDYKLQLNNRFSMDSSEISCSIKENNIFLTKLNNEFKVSIIVPVYNVENYLSECLDSICNQTLEDIEIICINDGSSDDSLKILEEYSKKDDRIVVISKENGGQGIARNLGINLAKGEYIGFVDSDDWIEPDMFEKLYDKAHKNNLDVNMCRLSLFDEKTGNFDNSTWYYGLKHFDRLKNDIFDYSDTIDFLTSISVTPVNKIYKRNFLINNNLKFAEDLIFEDEAFFYAMFFKASKISLIKEELYYYRINRINSTVTNTNNNKDIISIYKIIRNFLKKNGFRNYIHKIDNRFLNSIFNRFYQSDSKNRKEFFIEFKELLYELKLTKDCIYNDLNILQKDFINDMYVKSNFTSSWNFLSNLENNIFYNLKKFICADTYEEFVEYDKHKEFSIIMAIYNTELYLEDAIDSVINQNFGFESNVELILVDDGSTDSSREICLKYANLYPNNINYFFQENQGQATARNLGIRYAKGDYINFLDSDDKLNYDVLSKVHNFFEENSNDVDVVSIPLSLFDRETGDHALNYKFSSTRVVDLFKEPDAIQLHISSSFIKRKCFDNLRFNQDLIVAEDALLINQILLRKNKLGVISDTKYWYRKRKDGSSTVDSAALKWDFYLPKFEIFYNGLFDFAKNKIGYIPEFIQFVIMYDVKWHFFIDDIDKIFDENSLNNIYKFLHNILIQIDDKIINMQSQLQGNRKKFIFCLKYENNMPILLNYNKLYKYAGNNEIDLLNYHRIYIDIVDIKNNFLKFSGVLNSFFTNDVSIQLVKFDNDEFLDFWISFLNDNKELFLKDNFDDINLNNIEDLLHRNIIDSNKYNFYLKNKYEEFLNKQNEIYNVNRVNYPYRDKKFFGLSYESSYSFDVSIPLANNKKFNFAFRVNFNDFNCYLDVVLFDYSGLSKESWYSKKENFLISFKDNIFNIVPYSKKEMCKLELKNISSLKENNSDISEIVNIRRKVFLNKLFLNKKIWLFMDRQDLADDNAEALFRYALTQNDNIEKYFVINRDSIHFNKLKELGNIIEFGSRKHKELYLLAEKVISSHPDEEVLNPFWKDDFKYVSGIISSKRIFLQHGVTKDNVSRWLKKYDKHLDLIVTVSDIERDSFYNYYYNYDDDVVQVLGFPRYDNLDNKSNKKQILIMPSWRNDLSYKNENQIKQSEYFLRFNSLLNNEKLINICKSNEYKLIFKPHPNVYKFIDLFDRNDYVIFDEGTRYQDLFNNSSLLITDYSSVSFDFSYIKKPIIYYQYANDYNFNERYFDYETMGFGEIVKLEDDLINIIKEYLENNCEMKEKYSSRVVGFYKFSDRNNSKRVYDFIKKLD